MKKRKKMGSDNFLTIDKWEKWDVTRKIRDSDGNLTMKNCGKVNQTWSSHQEWKIQGNAPSKMVTK
jgi:hypothetical protein